MNIAVIKHENGVEEMVKIEGQEEIQEEELSSATAVLQNMGHLAQCAEIQYPVLVDPHQSNRDVNSDGNLQIMQQAEPVTRQAAFAYVIQSEYINENGETTVEYRMADQLTEGQHYIVQEFRGPGGENQRSDDYQTVYVQHLAETQTPTQDAEEGYAVEEEDIQLQPQQQQQNDDDDGQMTIVEDVEAVEEVEEAPTTESLGQILDSAGSTGAEDQSTILSIKFEESDKSNKELDSEEIRQKKNQISLTELLKKNSETENKDTAADEKMYPCFVCDKTFKTEKEVKLHFTVAHITTDGSATYGDGTSEQMETLEVKICPCCDEPLESAHKKGDFKCEKCDGLFVYKLFLQRHCSIEHPIGDDYTCAECHEMFPSKSKLIMHMRVHTDKPIRCECCGRQFTRKFHLERHLTQTGCLNVSVPLYECKVCGRKYSRKDNLAEHLKEHLGTAKAKAKIPYACLYCPKEFSSSTMLNIHTRTHTGERPYPCDSCEKKFPSSAALRKHKRLHTGEKPYSCSKCSKKFAAKETLNRHIKTHTGVKPHTCHICGKAFIQATQLRAHIFHHTGENAFICSYCGRAFNRNLRLTNHIKFLHEGAEPLKCSHPDCTKSFFRKEDLVRHMSVHSDEKRHQCDECGKQFATKSTLKAHSYTHRKEKPVSCDTCGHVFLRHDCLVRHIRARHRDVLEDIVATAEKKKIKKRLIEIATQTDAKHILNKNRVWNEFTLTESIRELLTLLVDEECLKDFGYPDTPVDRVLESVLKRCGHEPASQEKFDYIERLRENTKLLFNVVIDDESVNELLSNQTVDEVILHILKLTKKLTDDDKDSILRSVIDIGSENDENADDPDIPDENFDNESIDLQLIIDETNEVEDPLGNNSEGQRNINENDELGESSSNVEEVYTIENSENNDNIQEENFEIQEVEESFFIEATMEYNQERTDDDQQERIECFKPPSEETTQPLEDIHEEVFQTVYVEEFDDDENTQENIIIELMED